MKDYLKVDREDRNKFLTLMMGHCYHEPTGEVRPYHDFTQQDKCKCGCWSTPYQIHNLNIRPIHTFRQEIDFSSNDGFFTLWNFFKQATWFRECYNKMFERERDNGCESYTVDCLEDYIEPDKFADAIYKWHTRYR